MQKRLFTLLTCLTMMAGCMWGQKPPFGKTEAKGEYKALIADKDSLYWAVKTNLLYDAMLIPNISAELYVGKNWSLGLGYWYTWLSNRKKHQYWRTYGGEINVRKYFGTQAVRKPLTGHHIGMMSQIMMYDFQLGNNGYMSDCSYSVGIEYGYSIPIGRRLNLDLGLAVGYLGGEYKKYKHIDTHNVWQSTRNRHWFGPVKAEVTLAWQLGKTNINKRKEARYETYE